MEKTLVYKREYEKIKQIFNDVEDNKKELVEGLIQDASFLYAENYVLRELIMEVGMIKINPVNKALQKSTEAGKQYLKNVNSYSIVIKTLNSILQKNVIEEDDDFDKWIKDKMSINE
ncbi:hypothetical protein [Clostridium ihumii]|uniref:hypothetical protein n=1 Tax=Clostridium ihumii TaxID=1470356 RepID=UPI003D34A224